MKARYYDTVVQAQETTSKLRINAVDLVRGLIMIMMAFCHTRDYIGSHGYENVYWDTSLQWQGTSGIHVLQQIFTLIVPGGFFMLMGIGIVYFYHSRINSGWSLAKTLRFLLVRGFLLIVLQMTLLQAFEMMAERTIFIYMGVLFALGSCMLVASCVEYLSQRTQWYFFLPALLIAAITIPQQLYINHLQNQHIVANFWQILLLLGGVMHHGIKIDIDFTPIPWIPGAMIGLLMGHLMLKYKQNSMNMIGKIAVAFLVTGLIFLAIDFTTGMKIGDYRSYDSLSQASMLSLLCISKYPPSINYYLFSCGINLALIYLFSLGERSQVFCNIFTPVKTIGQCALFFYLLHWFVYYGLSLITPTQHFSQIQIMCAWLFGILILYPLCKLYLTFKQTKPTESLWRLF